MDPIIYKEQLQTEQYDSLSLNGKIKNLSRFSILLKNICRYVYNVLFTYFTSYLLYVHVFKCRTHKDSILISYDTDKLFFFFFSSTFRAFLCPWRFRLLLLQRNCCRIYKLRKSELLLFLFSSVVFHILV